MSMVHCHRFCAPLLMNFIDLEKFFKRGTERQGKFHLHGRYPEKNMGTLVFLVRTFFVGSQKP